MAFKVFNHNQTLLGDFATKQEAEVEAAAYRRETGNAAYVERAESFESLDVDKIAVGALDAACASIQDELGVTTGDLAGMFFSGEAAEQVLKVFKAYIRLEIETKQGRE